MSLYAGFEQAKAKALQLEQYVSEADAKLKAIPGINSGAMGLTPDSVRASNEYKLAKAEFNIAWEALRMFNAVYVKLYKRELAAERKLRRA